jgi:dihydrofolate reductase
MSEPEVTYMFAMSLDGFIARRDGRFDWLETFPANDDFNFGAFENSVTGIVMGRGSYDAAWIAGEWPYKRWPVVVATSRPLDDAPERVEATHCQPGEQVAQLRRMGAEGLIWLFGGGNLVRQYFEAGLLRTVEVGIIPVVLGDGIPAFGGLQPDRWLDLDFARPLKNGAIHARYAVRR